MPSETPEPTQEQRARAFALAYSWASLKRADEATIAIAAALAAEAAPLREEIERLNRENRDTEEEASDLDERLAREIARAKAAEAKALTLEKQLAEARKASEASRLLAADKQEELNDAIRARDDALAAASRAREEQGALRAAALEEAAQHFAQPELDDTNVKCRHIAHFLRRLAAGEKMTFDPAAAALAPPAQTQQGLSEGWRSIRCGHSLRTLLILAYDNLEECGGTSLRADLLDVIELIAPRPSLNPDKQPSPSAAPAQEPMKLQGLSEKFYRQGPLDETALLGQPASPEGALREALDREAVRLAEMAGFRVVDGAVVDAWINARSPTGDVPNMARELLRARAAIAGQPARDDARLSCPKHNAALRNMAYFACGCRYFAAAADDSKPSAGDGSVAAPNKRPDEAPTAETRSDNRTAASSAQPAREALRYARDHITGSAPLWRTQSEVIDIIDSALHDPIGTYRCPVCNKDTPHHHHHASIGQAAVAREDDQKALRAAALEEAARQLVEGDAALELRHDGGAPPVYFEVCVLCDEGNDRVGQNIKHNPQKACGKLAAALAGSPAGEGREDNQEQQSGKGE